MFDWIWQLIKEIIKKPEPITEDTQMKILIITKSKNNYGNETPTTLSTGLFNSSLHIVEALQDEPNITIKVVSVIDNNSIDREVTLFRPDIVIIEALWVVPEKFAVLKPLHPDVKWIVRIHSEIPFLSFEGIAFSWITKYLSEQNIYVALNSETTYHDFQDLFYLNRHQLLFLPNYFQLRENRPRIKPQIANDIHIGCFGAIRSLKNQLLQAVAAIRFADNSGVKLHFHINTGRVEGFGSENILKNIRSLFADQSDHELVEHEWMTPEEFYTLLETTIDLNLQVSFSETFNLISAESINCGVPIVVSDDVFWAEPACQVKKETSITEIVSKMNTCYRFRKIMVYDSFERLEEYGKKVKRILISQLQSILDRQ